LFTKAAADGIADDEGANQGRASDCCAKKDAEMTAPSVLQAAENQRVEFHLRILRSRGPQAFTREGVAGAAR
jgi:hypothetical protein